MAKILKPIKSAPYYAAMASLRSGGELATVFTSPDAATPIKSYSPELMVIPKYGKCINIASILPPATIDQTCRALFLAYGNNPMHSQLLLML